MLTNLGVASRYPWAFDGRRLVVGVEESAQAGTDLNGDGDATDVVLHLFDLTASTAKNLGLASFSTPLLEGSLVAGFVREVDQGATDLNGDGDITDYVVHVYDDTTGTTTNLGFATPAQGYLFGGKLVFAVRESAQGATDLNGDGDATDEVLNAYDVAAGVATNLGVATSGFYAEAGHLALAVSEAWQGSTDLNGDGDATDWVLHTLDLVTGTVVNTGYAAYSSVLAGNALAFEVDESSQGGLDLNGDGDTTDGVLHLRDLRTGTTTNLGLAGGGMNYGEGNALILGVYEAAQGGTDLNGDGDAMDFVLHACDPSAGTVENLGVASIGAFFPTDRNLVATTESEFAAGVDLNGDGDTFDDVAVLLTLDVRYGMTGEADFVPLGAGGHQDLLLDAGPSARGDLYVVLGSASGTSPGIPFWSVLLPLNYDGYWSFTATNPNTPVLSSSLGLLDGQGEAQARFALPAGMSPSLAGVTLHHAALVDVATWQFSFASNAFGVMLVP